MKNNKKWLAIVLTAIIVTFVCVVGMPVSANGASVTRDLPYAINPNEEFVVTLTQSGFFPLNTGTVNETLPEGFTYVPDSLTGNANATFDETTNNLTIDFKNETTVTYNVTASTYEQIPAEFSGIYKTLTAGGGMVEIGDVGGDTDVVVDGTPPYTEGHEPAPDTTDVPVDSNITLHVKDDGAGVDPNTIVMTVEGVNVTSDIAKIPVNIVNLNDILVTYDPPDFGYGQVVNVTIEASDLAGNAMTTDSYSFTTEEVPVTEKSDLVITEKWVCWPENCTICYNITNIGNGTAPADLHNTTLYVDETEVTHDQVTEDLAPNESYIGCFEGYFWTYTTPEDNITVCADNDGMVDELNETNNCLTNIWMCGDIDGDHFITGYDAYLVYIEDIRTSKWAADPDHDGYITGYDAYLVYIEELNCKCSS